MNETLLSQCIEGACGVISRIDNRTHLASRLRELGMVPGEWVRVLRSGKLTLLQVGDSRFCVHTDQLEGIALAPVTDSLN